VLLSGRILDVVLFDGDADTTIFGKVLVSMPYEFKSGLNSVLIEAAAGLDNLDVTFPSVDTVFVNIGTIRRGSVDVDATDQGSVDVDTVVQYSVDLDTIDQGSVGRVDAAGRSSVNANVGDSDSADTVAGNLAFSRKRIIW
jgi:hypothetical protein